MWSIGWYPRGSCAKDSVDWCDPGGVARTLGLAPGCGFRVAGRAGARLTQSYSNGASEQRSPAVTFCLFYRRVLSNRLRIFALHHQVYACVSLRPRRLPFIHGYTIQPLPWLSWVTLHEVPTRFVKFFIRYIERHWLIDQLTTCRKLSWLGY